MTRTDEPTIQELFDLTGKAALISGASGWLGTSFARALAEAGASVVVSSRDKARAEETAAALPSPGGAAHFGVQLDHMDGESIEAGFRDAVEAAGKLDVLVNNGLEANSKGIADVTFEEFARHQANNAGYFALARLIRDHAVERGAPASIVMIGSMYGMVGSYPDAYEGTRLPKPRRVPRAEGRDDTLDPTPGRLLGAGQRARELPEPGRLPQGPGGRRGDRPAVGQEPDEAPGQAPRAEGRAAAARQRRRLLHHRREHSSGGRLDCLVRRVVRDSRFGRRDAKPAPRPGGDTGPDDTTDDEPQARWLPHRPDREVICCSGLRVARKPLARAVSALAPR